MADEAPCFGPASVLEARSRRVADPLEMVMRMTTLKTGILVAAAAVAFFASAPQAEAQKAKPTVRADVASRAVVRQKVARKRVRRAVAVSVGVPPSSSAASSRELYFCAPAPI